MNEVLLSLSIAYVFLAALLLLALIHSSINWLLKMVLLIVALGFYWLSYQGWKETQGWPTITELPERFLLHYAVIEEPDEETGTKGAIFVWLSDLKNFKPAQQPRSHQLEYDQKTHAKVEEALREVQNGTLQIGEVKPATELKEGVQNKNRIGLKYPGLEFVELPDPALPEK